MPHRVIQLGTGNTGAHSLHFLLADPAFNVVGVWVNRERNVGRTAGELAGRAANGPRATRDVDDLVALDADCVVYMAAEPSGPPNEPGADGWDSVETMCRLLDSGKNVVATGISGLTNPRAFGDGVYNRLRLAADSGGTTFFGTGIVPRASMVCGIRHSRKRSNCAGGPVRRCPIFLRRQTRVIAAVTHRFPGSSVNHWSSSGILTSSDVPRPG